MRVYTRGVDEALVIGRTVKVSILEVQTTCVRLAINDPNATPAYREEVLYLPSDDGDCECDVDLLSSCNIFDEELTFEDEDSRLFQTV
jgi:carbon storage regulator CsrA